jgi:hypothetical protein
MLAMSLVSNKPFSKRVPPSKLELNDEVSEVFSLRSYVTLLVVFAMAWQLNGGGVHRALLVLR